MKSGNWYFLFAANCCLMLLISCNTTRHLDERQYLLVKNKIQVDNASKEVSSSDLYGLIQQKPNDRFLGIFPIKLWINSISKKLGEPPVVLDNSLTQESKSQLIKYLNNIGYYDSRIYDSVIYRKQKAEVKYRIQLAKPYIIRNVNYAVNDDSIQQIIDVYNFETKIKPGNTFNSLTLDEERDRITSRMMDYGFFGFSKDYFFYEADSTVGSRQVDLTLKLNHLRIPDTTLGQIPQYEKHKVYFIHQVNVFPDYSLFISDATEKDTLIEDFYHESLKQYNQYRFIYKPPLKIKPRVISRSMFINNDRKYNATDATQTYKKLNELRIYKYVDVNFQESPYVSSDYPKRRYLDCNVSLTRNPVNSYSVELQGTNSGGDLGLAAYLVYQNKNLFRGAEVLSLRLKGAIEAQETTGNVESSNQTMGFFNSYEFGINANLDIPKFLAPIQEEVFSRYFRPKTTINLGYNVQNWIEYDRTISNLTFGYEWSESRIEKHTLFPIDINLVKVKTTPEFDEFLAGESQRYRNQYTDHLIIGLRYSYIYNNQDYSRLRNFSYFRGDFDIAGNLLQGLVKLSDQEKNEEGYYTIFGIRYSQYAKAGLDYRYYIMLDRGHSVAMRSFVGIAVPFGNSIDIPYEKGFFGGGANGMRAWPLRYLGPGAYQALDTVYNTTGDTTAFTVQYKDIERVGDIMLEANIEYRFPIYRFFQGALFYDVGNIWLIRDNETFPGGKFDFSKFVSELAMDFGLGLRLDFKYFIFRLDFAQKIRDPERPKNDRWIIGIGNNWFRPVINLGIGYPF